ncbi:hypothetical protein B0H14DRAFT_3179441 [Mycena olivaceomarginata]|nr:hypothetical protein B0H14DRAFT_3179441 [Mycena olivaceomarginata]
MRATTYSIPQPGSAHWSNITVSLCANRESKREGISAYSIILTIKYSRLSPNDWGEEDARWFFDPTTEGSHIEWTSSDSFSAGLIERAFGEGRTQNAEMMDSGAKTQIVKTFHFVLVNELFPWTGRASEGHPSGEDCGNCIAGNRGHLGDEFSDGVLADDERNGEKLPRSRMKRKFWRLLANPNGMVTLL